MTADPRLRMTPGPGWAPDQNRGQSQDRIPGESQHLGRYLCRFDALPDGTARGFDPNDDGYDTIFVIRRGARLFGWHNNCPHHPNGAKMNWRKDAFLNGDGSRIMCAAHGALFDIESGVCEIGPCLGKRLVPARLTRSAGDVFYLRDDSGL